MYPLDTLRGYTDFLTRSVIRHGQKRTQATGQLILPYSSSFFHGIGVLTVPQRGVDRKEGRDKREDKRNKPWTTFAPKDMVNVAFEEYYKVRQLCWRSPRKIAFLLFSRQGDELTSHLLRPRTYCLTTSGRPSLKA